MMPTPSPIRRGFIALALLLTVTVTARAGDWPNSGGNAGRNGRSTEQGPTAPTLLWSTTTSSSIIAWQPIVVGSRVFQVRQTGFPPGGEPNGSPVVCQDLNTGAQLWKINIPYNAGDWTTYVAGASNGLLYASRAGNGGSVAAKLYALDQATGTVVWISQDVIKTGAYDGVVFAGNGDPIVAWHQKIMRIRASDGVTVWTSNRVGSVSGNCGPAVHGDAIYIADAAVGGHVIKKLSLATGALLYQSPVMIGFTLQNTPMVGPDGTIYLSRTQNNVITDFFYAFADTGSALIEKWHVPAGWSTGSEFGVGPDGSVYMLSPAFTIDRLDPATGAVLNSSIGLGTGINPRFAIDCDGKVFFSNGAFSNGALYSFNADLSLRWSVAVPNINIGGPVLGKDGTLVVSGIGTNVRAYRTNSAWKDLGLAMTGSLGKPTLCGSSPLTAGANTTLLLEYARPNSSFFLFIGASQANLPLLSGTLVPSPDIVFGPLPTGPQGILSLGSTWPAGVPSGAKLYFQDFIADSNGLFGAAATNGLSATTP